MTKDVCSRLTENIYLESRRVLSKGDLTCCVPRISDVSRNWPGSARALSPTLIIFAAGAVTK